MDYTKFRNWQKESCAFDKDKELHQILNDVNFDDAQGSNSAMDKLQMLLDMKMQEVVNETTDKVNSIIADAIVSKGFTQKVKNLEVEMVCFKFDKINYIYCIWDSPIDKKGYDMQTYKEICFLMETQILVPLAFIKKETMGQDKPNSIATKIGFFISENWQDFKQFVELYADSRRTV
jgi:uncharacterized Ntn-hydrolase superfamily protein